MDDFQRFHRKALIWMLGSLIVVALGCVAANAAGQWWIVLLLLPGGCVAIRIVYNIQCRRFHNRRNKK